MTVTRTVVARDTWASAYSWLLIEFDDTTSSRPPDVSIRRSRSFTSAFDAAARHGTDDVAVITNDEQRAHIGRQTGGRVFLFLYTDDFDRDYRAYSSRGVTFVRGPAEEAYGKVAVFTDLYGNRWDLIEPV